MSPKEPPKGPVVVKAPDGAQPAAQPQVPIMIRDEKDQVLDWLFTSCRAKNGVIQEMNQVLQTTQQQFNTLVEENAKLKAEIERLNGLLNAQQPQQPAIDGPGGGIPAEPAIPVKI